MKQLLLILALVLVGCGDSKEKTAAEARSATEARAKSTEEAKAASDAKLIANPHLEKKVRKELKKPKGELTKEDLEKVENIYYSGWHLTGIPKGLEKLPQLKKLDLESNKLTDMTGLEKLTQLWSLDLYGNQLTDVTGLEKLTQLTYLNIGNQLTDVRGLEKLTQLKELFFENNQLPEVPKELEKLTKLTFLNLGGNQLTDVKEMEKLTQLTLLNLEGNQLTDVKGLEKLTQLDGLDLDGNPDLTRAQIDELKKALPKCDIRSNPTKQEKRRSLFLSFFFLN